MGSTATLPSTGSTAWFQHQPEQALPAQPEPVEAGDAAADGFEFEVERAAIDRSAPPAYPRPVAAAGHARRAPAGA
ncbi:hypothetical protein ACVOMV_34525 [Mesorhizobium atlanticum]